MQVVIPARNEERTIGSIAGALSGRGIPVVVVDSASSDRTAEAARAAGADVVVAPSPGKGLALRLGVEAAHDEVLVFCDADVTSFRPEWVEALAGPLRDPSVHLVKPLYRRPLRLRDMEPALDEGGRVTAILARPLLGTLAPELSFVAQPLAGEYAARRSTLLGCGFPDGYGVEIALLLQIADRYGVAAVGQVDLKAERWHRNRPLHELSATATEVLQTALAVLEEQGRVKLGSPLDIVLTRPRG